MRRTTLFCWGLAGMLGLLLIADQLRGQSVSLGSLLDEIVDRDNLARFPQPAYTCSQASSYDRGTVAPDKPGWFANMDRSYFVRTEEKDGHKEYVLMDVEGPGSVVRMWATWHGPGGKDFSDGTLRFYLDHNDEPVIEGPISKIIDGGGLITGPLAEGVSPDTPYGQRGHNLYLPIPYSQHCKVTYETSVLVDEGAYKGEALYYQINYRTYPNDTPVESFTMQQLEQQQAKIDQVQQRLVESGPDNEAVLQAISFAGPLAAAKMLVQRVPHPSAIRQLTVKLSAENEPQALRSTVLQIEFDGQRTVWCPVGAFFGRGYQSKPFRTWYTEVTEDGTMSCFWVMPFQQEFEVSLINLSRGSVVEGQVTAKVGNWDWDERSMHFCGSWRQLTEVASFRDGATKPGEGAFDVNYVEVAGKGVYVGDTLTIFNGTDAWWGEGDEKIFVDHESFPSHVGTGTEDYYGYAWCRPEFFQSPFHAQPSGAGNFTPGLSVNSRYRSLDAIPFTESIKFDMELWHWRNTTVNFAPAAFWYARPGATSNVQPDPETAARRVALKRSDIVEVFVVKDALEGEQLKIIQCTGGTTEKQEIGHLRWSNDNQIWWKDGKPGDRLTLAFPVAAAGRYEVVANLTKANDYGIVQLAVNDNEPQEFDRYHPTVAHDKLVVGTFDLPQGQNRLTVSIVGANDKAIKRYMFGLDYLLLVPKS